MGVGYGEIFGDDEIFSEQLQISPPNIWGGILLPMSKTPLPNGSSG